jgi:hypothetical protein
VVAAAGCSESQYTKPPPTLQFTWPFGLAVHRLSGGGTALLVGSTNTDLLYTASSGGTVMSVDPSTGTLRQLGVVTMASFGGPLAVADDDTCAGLTAAGVAPKAVVGSRYSDEVVLADIGAAGELSCPAGCARQLPLGSVDPFAVAIACRGDRRRAYVGYLASNIVVSVDLATGRTIGRYTLLARPYGVAYDPAHDRLWVTELAVNAAPLEALDLGAGCTPTLEGCDIRRTYNLWPALPGLEVAGIVIANPVPGQPTRAYVAGRIYDASLAATLGYRPDFDVGAALLVLDLPEGPLGFPTAPVVRRIVPLAVGASQIAVLSPRTDPTTGASLRDVVVVTSTTEGVVTVYDDEAGAIAKVFALAQTGRGPENPAGMPMGTPLVGKQPIGLAVQPHAAPGDVDWVYVSAFESSGVTAISVDPAAPSGAQIAWTQYGAVQ